MRRRRAIRRRQPQPRADSRCTRRASASNAISFCVRWPNSRGTCRGPRRSSASSAAICTARCAASASRRHGGRKPTKTSSDTDGRACDTLSALFCLVDPSAVSHLAEPTLRAARSARGSQPFLENLRAGKSRELQPLRRRGLQGRLGDQSDQLGLQDALRRVFRRHVRRHRRPSGSSVRVKSVRFIETCATPRCASQTPIAFTKGSPPLLSRTVAAMCLATATSAESRSC